MSEPPFPSATDAVHGQPVSGEPNISRVWQYNKFINRWELITDASLSFASELPIKVTSQDGQITHDFDVQDLPDAL